MHLPNLHINLNHKSFITNELNTMPEKKHLQKIVGRVLVEKRKVLATSLWEKIYSYTVIN